jgi:antitoxin MazE
MSLVIAKWGNSAAVRLPAFVLAETGVKAGDKVDIVVNEDKSITMRPVRKNRPNLEALLAAITPENLPNRKDIDDAPQGKEIW